MSNSSEKTSPLPTQVPTESSPKTEAAPSAPKASSDLASVQTPVWKKILYWVIGIVAAVGAFIGLIFLLKGGSSAKAAAQKQVDKAKKNIAEADLEAKIKVAEARKEEQAVVEKLKDLRKIDDEYKRAQELAKLL